MKSRLFLGLTFLACLARGTVCCNEAVCASVVSRCSLLKSCDCAVEPDGCACCEACFACLEHLQFECCSCVGLCPETNATTEVAPWNKSVVADLRSPEPPPRRRDVGAVAGPAPNATARDPCTVVYLKQCLAEKSCERSCLSTGAGSYRWFHDGCCECVGPACLGHGLAESRCEVCGAEEEPDALAWADASDDEREHLGDAAPEDPGPPPPQKSTVGAFAAPAPQLWSAVTRGDDASQRWRTFRFPQEAGDAACGLADQGACVAEETCEALCRTAGAAKYRWFPSGCCRCLDGGCPGYGPEDAPCDACRGGDPP